jgi:biopolymer transport protein ExbD
MQTTLSLNESDPDWTRLRPVIDDAIIALKDEEREAIALRFFENCSFAEVGAALRVTEEAARKRVDRGLEKLRVLLARRGITSTAAALGVALAAIATITAPAGLTAKIAAHAITQGAAATGGSIVSPVASALLPAAAALVIGGVLIGLQRHSNDGLRRELAQVATESNAIAALRVENLRLARNIVEAEESQRRQAASAPPAPSPVVMPAAAPRPVSARVNVSPQGTLAWDQQPVKLHEFIARLRMIQVTADPESRIVIQGLGANFSSLAYVIEEIRKSQLKHVTVESDATPDPKYGWSWF